jgi:hypothetical protein
MPGSLVLISPDKFDTILWGIIKQRDGKEMNETSKRHKFVDIRIEIMMNSIELENEPLVIYNAFKNEVMDMIESTAYFESYVHVLRKIKEMDRWDRIPFENIFALGDKSAMPKPQYLEEDLWMEETT